MANFEDFKSMYKSNFGGWKWNTSDDRFWNEFVQPCEAKLLQEALEFFADAYAAKRNGYREDNQNPAYIAPPSLSEVKNKYWQLKKRRDDAQNGPRIEGHCAWCEDTGSVMVILRTADYSVMNPNKPEALEYPQMGEYAVPCMCERGKRSYRRKPNKEPDWLLKRYQDNCFKDRHDPARKTKYNPRGLFTWKDQIREFMAACERLAGIKQRQEEECYKASQVA